MPEAVGGIDFDGNVEIVLRGHKRIEQHGVTGTLRPGEIVYADDEGVFSRHAKDSHRTRVRESTTRVLFVVDGCPGVVEGDLDRACALLTDTLRDVVPGCEPTSPRPATVAD